MATRTPTYYSGTITGQAGTLITLLDAVLVTGEGWTKTYSGTNKAVYTQASGNGFCFRVLDDASLTGAGREAMVRGGESATDVDTLVDPFPLVSQVADNSCVWRKSETADATARNWEAVADGSNIVLYMHTNTNNYDMYIYGDTESQYAGEAYNTLITVRNQANSTAIAIAMAGTSLATIGATSFPISNGGMFFCRSANGLVKSEFGAFLRHAANTFGNCGNYSPYPHTVTNKMHLRMVECSSSYNAAGEPTGIGTMPRGVIPFMLEPLIGVGVTSMNPFDTWEDTAYDATADSLKIYRFSNAWTDGSARRVVLQIAGTWDPGF